jgi:hypothetical protein
MLLAAIAGCGDTSANGTSNTTGGGGSSGASNGGAAGATGTAGNVGSQGGSGQAAGTGGNTMGAGGNAMGGAGGSGQGGDPPMNDGGGVGTPCAQPVFVTSDPNGGWSDGGYYVHNNMWNSAAGLGPETLSACSYHSWFVVSNQTNNAGAVKTYPNVHKDYNDVPISSFNRIASSFAETSPHVGIYNVAYDIWMNGVATSNSIELMIWTENYKQVPAGQNVMTATLGGRTYDVWKTQDSHYLAFVPKAVFTSGTVDILEIFKWTMAQGWLPAGSTLGQICFGVEIVYTGGGNATWQFTDFSITSN